MKGSLVAIVTPMNADGTVDYKSFENLIHFHENAGTDGLVLAGTTGESATLSSSERNDIFSFVSSATKIPLMAGVGSASTREALELVEIAQKNNIFDCLAVTPFYNRPSQKGLFLHFSELAKPESNIYLYNVPGRTGVDLLPATVKQLIRTKNIVGLKEAVATSERFTELAEILVERPDFILLSGDDLTFVNFMEKGALGVISVAANIIPNVIKNLSDLCLVGSFDQAKRDISKYLQFFELLFLEASPSPSKYLLEKKGLLKNNLRLPLHPLSDEHRETIELAYEQIK